VSHRDRPTRWCTGWAPPTLPPTSWWRPQQQVGQAAWCLAGRTPAPTPTGRIHNALSDARTHVINAMAADALRACRNTVVVLVTWRQGRWRCRLCGCARSGHDRRDVCIGRRRRVNAPGADRGDWCEAHTPPTKRSSEVSPPRRAVRTSRCPQPRK
jgi:hypothetical protein